MDCGAEPTLLPPPPTPPPSLLHPHPSLPRSPSCPPHPLITTPLPPPPPLRSTRPRTPPNPPPSPSPGSALARETHPRDNQWTTTKGSAPSLAGLRTHLGTRSTRRARGQTAGLTIRRDQYRGFVATSASPSKTLIAGFRLIITMHRSLTRNGGAAIPSGDQSGIHSFVAPRSRKCVPDEYPVHNPLPPLIQSFGVTASLG